MKQYRFSLPGLFLLLQSISVCAQQGKWNELKTKNEVANRSECGMAAVNGKLYLIGGDSGGPMAVERFDPVTLTWTKLAEAPLLMHHFQAVSYDNKVYVPEAFSSGGFPSQVPMPGVQVYDVKTDTWQKGGEMPVARRRAGAGAAMYKGKLYLVAGIQHGHSGGTTNMFDVYDPVMQTWSVLPDAPHIRDHCSAAVVKNKLYVVGGRNTSFRDPENKINFFSQTMPDVDCYDFASGTWSVLSARLPMGSGGGAVVNYNDVLYYMGGERATETEPNAPRKNTFYLDPKSHDGWKEADSLHFGRNGMAAAVINNKIYVAGGSGGGPGGPGGPGGLPGMQHAGIDSTHPGNNMDSLSHPPFPQHLPPGGNHPNQNDYIKIEVFTLK